LVQTLKRHAVDQVDANLEKRPPRSLHEQTITKQLWFVNSEITKNVGIESGFQARALRRGVDVLVTSIESV
jgi:hypothetical protein